MKIITYNTWFDDFAFEIRRRALFKLLEESQADFLCLQEVELRLLEPLSRLKWVCEQYVISDPEGVSLQSYGVIILAKRELRPRFLTYPLPTRMGRQLVVAQCKLGNGEISVATVHLESLNNADVRRQQLKRIVRILEDRSAILCGDFNFCSYRNFNVGDRSLENDMLVEFCPDFVDIWPNVHPSHPGFTFDSQINRMLRMPRGDERMRYDRILARLAGTEHRVIGVDLIGTTPIAGHQDIFISDHFGMCAEFEFEGA